MSRLTMFAHNTVHAEFKKSLQMELLTQVLKKPNQPLHCVDSMIEHVLQIVQCEVCSAVVP